MKVHHIGYAVKKIEKAAEVFKSLGYCESEIVEDDSRGIRIMFMENGTERIELVAPAAAGSPVDGVLKNAGPTPYHICYETDKLDFFIEQLRASGWMLVKEPQPAPAIGDAAVAFLYNRHIGMIELLEVK